MAKVNYLNNKDILLEITKSKNTYSEFVDSKYELYDSIITSLDEITPELIASIKEKIVTNEYQDERTRLREMGDKKGMDRVVKRDPNEIPTEDIVFRYMTFDHIPENLERVKRKKQVSDYKEKVNFPPFKHMIVKDGEIKEVGRSHWKDGFHNGYFSIDHGKMTDELARMIFKLVEKYSQKGNWRGFSISSI